ncbi:MAG: MFS transporter [Solirubrobacterales bacterium]
MKYRDFYWASGGHFATDLYFNLLPALLPVVSHRLGLSLTQVGFVTMASMVAANFFQPLLGHRFDRRPNRLWPRVSLVASGFFMVLCGLPVGYGLFGLLAVVGGFANGAFHPLGSVVAYQSNPRQRGFFMSMYSTAGSFGFAIGPAIAAVMIQTFQTPVSLLALALPLPLFWHYLGKIDLSKLQTQSESAGEPNGLKGILTAGVVVLTLIMILRAWGHLAFCSYLVFLLQERGFTYVAAANLLTAFLIAASVGGLGGGKLSDGIGRRAVVLITLVGSALFSGLFLVSSGPLSLVFLILAGLGIGGSFPVLIVLGQELMPNNIGLASGISMGFAWGMAAFGIYLNGIVGDLYGLTASFWMTTGILALAAIMTAGAIAVLAWRRQAKQA